MTKSNEAVIPDESRPAVMTIDEAAAYLRIPRSTTYKYAKRGMIPAGQIGKHWRFRMEDLDAYLRALCARNVGRKA